MANVAFFGKTEGQLRAEQALLDAEDRLIAYHPDEAIDLGFHSNRDADRMKVIVARQRLTHEMVKITSRRNVAVTLLVGIVLLAKGVITPEGISQALHVIIP